jgi:serine/threonine protein kinase
MIPILDGLKAVHQHYFLHRDIKPKNIFITRKGMPILLDFGAARLSSLDSPNTLTVMLSRGFAPFEQYHEKGAQGPWSDIYACSATLYYMVTGKVPPDAIERRHSDQLVPPIRLNPSLRESFNLAILKAMAINPAARPQNVEQFKRMLLNSTALDTTIIEPLVRTAKIGAQAPPLMPSIPAKSASTAKNRKIQAKSQTLAKDSGLSLGQWVITVMIGLAVFFAWDKKQSKIEHVTVSKTTVEGAKPILEPYSEEKAPDYTVTESPRQPEPQPEPSLVLTEISAPESSPPKVGIVEDNEKPQSTSQYKFEPRPKPKPVPETPFQATAQPPQPIPQPAYDVCAQQQPKSDCGLQTPTGYEEGRCLPAQPGLMACIPYSAPEPPTLVPR